jgi:hypothetical protein
MEGLPLELDADVTALPHGTKVGAWRLKGCRGRGGCWIPGSGGTPMASATPMS